MRRIGALRPFSFRLEITHLLLAGRMNLGLQLSHEAPGIKGVEYSFLQEPEFEIQARGGCMYPDIASVTIRAVVYRIQRFRLRRI